MKRSFRKFAGFIMALAMTMSAFAGLNLAVEPAVTAEAQILGGNNGYYGTYSGDYYDYSYDYYDYSYDYYDYSYDYYDYSYDYYDYSYDYYDYSYDYYDYSFNYYDGHYYFDGEAYDDYYLIVGEYGTWDTVYFNYMMDDYTNRYFVDEDGALRVYLNEMELEELKLPEGIKSVDMRNDYQIDLYDVEKLTLPSGVEDVYLCGQFSSVSLPSTVTSLTIGYCPCLEKITVPKNVKTLGIELFDGEHRLKSISVPKSVTELELKGDGSYISILSFSKNKNFEIYKNGVYKGTTLLGYDHTQKELVIKDGTKKISTSGTGFYSYTITKITIPDSVVSISDYAFSELYYVKELKLPSKLKTIGKYAFSEMMNLTSVTLPSKITVIPEGAFEGCGKLAKVTFKGKVTEIGDRAFQMCALTSVTIPKTVKTIGDSAFASTELKKVTIPAATKSIGRAAFADCESLTKITVKSSNKNYASYKGCLLNKSKTIVYTVPGGLDEVVLPSTVTGFDDYYTAITQVSWYDRTGTARDASPKGYIKLGKETEIDDTILYRMLIRYQTIKVYKGSQAYEVIKNNGCPTDRYTLIK